MPAFTIRRAWAERTSCTFCTTSTIRKHTAGLPKDPQIPLLVRIWKGPLKWLGNLAMIGGVLGVAIHYLRFGPKGRGRQNDRAIHIPSNGSAMG